MHISDEDKDFVYEVLNQPHFYRDTELEPPPTQEEIDKLNKWYDDEKSPIENYRKAFNAALTLPENLALASKLKLPAEPVQLIWMLFCQQDKQARQILEQGIDLLAQQ